jgi:hypothetical protein
MRAIAVNPRRLQTQAVSFQQSAISIQTAKRTFFGFVRNIVARASSPWRNTAKMAVLLIADINFYNPHFFQVLAES